MYYEVVLWWCILSTNICFVRFRKFTRRPSDMYVRISTSQTLMFPSVHTIQVWCLCPDPQKSWVNRLWRELSSIFVVFLVKSWKCVVFQPSSIPCHFPWNDVRIWWQSWITNYGQRADGWKKASKNAGKGAVAVVVVCCHIRNGVVSLNRRFVNSFAMHFHFFLSERIHAWKQCQHWLDRTVKTIKKIPSRYHKLREFFLLKTLVFLSAVWCLYGTGSFRAKLQFVVKTIDMVTLEKGKVAKQERHRYSILHGYLPQKTNNCKQEGTVG